VGSDMAAMSCHFYPVGAGCGIHLECHS